ncbi:MAG: SEC59/DGK1/VTE5 family protein [Candidatus ainarchaeum sp.]|nr:SEC59/DGK1/VTE5 family protein [Candidatus ainarchaeum sp.]
MDFELKRQSFHAVVGIIAIAILLAFGREAAMAIIFAVLVGGTLLINLRMLGIPVPIIEGLEKRFERKDAPVPGWGSACYAAGALIAITFLTDTSQIAATLLILALGDSVSTVVGTRFGKNRLPYNSKKTIEGTLAFFFTSLASWYFVGPTAIPVALVATIAETIPAIDDNLTIPIACVAFFLVAL